MTLWIGTSVEDMKKWDMTCPNCGWIGKGAEALIQPNDLVRCPKCNTPTETEGQNGTSGGKSG
jgi:DNA-directed RNA polymerase subunit RPC12/RpoP